MATLEGMAASAGLGPLGSLGPLLVGVVLLLIIVKLLSMPFKLVWNGICGALLLWLFILIAARIGAIRALYSSWALRLWWGLL